MNNIALGRYLPLNSIVHKMDPRYKLVAMLADRYLNGRVQINHMLTINNGV